MGPRGAIRGGMGGGGGRGRWQPTFKLSVLQASKLTARKDREQQRRSRSADDVSDHVVLPTCMHVLTCGRAIGQGGWEAVVGRWRQLRGRGCRVEEARSSSTRTLRRR